MNILSLFDGISCARVALERAGIKVDKYYASEIDKYAIQIAQKNYPDTIQLGDIKLLTQTRYLEGTSEFDFRQDIDLMIGGSPCQDLSIAKKNREGLKGCRSGLFYEFVRLIKAVKPRYFILENVNSMPKEAKEQISEILGVQPMMINAALVSAQNRKRLFWVGKLNCIAKDGLGAELYKYEQVVITQPEDRGILLKDILEKEVGKKYTYNPDNKINTNQGNRVYPIENKAVSLKALGGGGGAKTGLYLIQTPRGNNKGGKKAMDGKTPTLSSSSWEHNNKLVDEGVVRKLTPIECERLQSLPDNYTEGVSNSQRYKTLGNGMNVEVIRHILSFIK